MPDYTLNIAFSKEDLKIIYVTGSNVIVAKPTMGGKADVAWQVFKPMQANTLNWEEEYGVYASTSSIKDGAELTQLSNVPVPAAINKLYTLESNSTFSGPSSGGSANAFSVLNKYDVKEYMTVGLYQNAKVNGTEILNNAISAAGVMLNFTATMTPFTTVYVWLQSHVKSNCVVTTVTSPQTKIIFGGGINNVSVKYDASTGHFIPAGKTQVEITQIEALL